jgi:hypothetical protein
VCCLLHGGLVALQGSQLLLQLLAKLHGAGVCRSFAVTAAAAVVKGGVCTTRLLLLLRSAHGCDAALVQRCADAL